MRFDASFWRALVAIGFNGGIAFGFRFFGASGATTWFTFLALMGFVALVEIGMALQSIDRKLDAIIAQTHS